MSARTCSTLKARSHEQVTMEAEKHWRSWKVQTSSFKPEVSTDCEDEVRRSFKHHNWLVYVNQPLEGKKQGKRERFLAENI